MNKILSKKNKGFTLVEALVAVSILMVAVASPMTIAQRGLSSAIFSKEQMIASYLAQDVIEYIKNKRDQVGLNADPLNPTSAWFPTFSCNTTSCDINTLSLSSDDSKTYVSHQDNLLSIEEDKDGNFLYYGHGSSKKSTFSRKVEMYGVGDEIVIKVTVYWKGGRESVSVTAYLYNYWAGTITNTP